MIDSELFDWMREVQDVLYEHPEWLAYTQQAIMDGMRLRLELESSLRNNAEVALIMAYNAGKSKMTEANRQTVERALLRCAFVQGTPFMNEIAARHREIEDHEQARERLDEQPNAT